MFDKFKGVAALGQLATKIPEIQKAAKEIKLELKDIKVAAESGGGAVRVWVSGELKIQKVEFSNQFIVNSEHKNMAESLVCEAVNLAIENAKRAAANCAEQKIKSLNLPIDSSEILSKFGIGSGVSM